VSIDKRLETAIATGTALSGAMLLKKIAFLQIDNRMPTIQECIELGIIGLGFVVCTKWLHQVAKQYSEKQISSEDKDI
jgi:hypothetical protein